MLRALVIGSGWGRHAAEALARMPEVELAGIVGRGSARTRGLTKRLGVSCYDDLDDAIGRAQPDAAMISVSERAHPGLVRKLLEAGCHVLCSHPVATDAATVLALDELARALALRVATDYTMRLLPAFEAARRSLASYGPPLRIAQQSPGRALPIAIDLALSLAGPAARVFAAGAYPPHLDERRRTAPQAFPPTIVVEHAGGCVTAITPVPHADPAAAHRLSISTERGRLDLRLPAGGLDGLTYRGGGVVERNQIVAASPDPAPPGELFGSAMRELVRRFVEGIVTGDAVDVPLVDEARVRGVWAAVGRSRPSGVPVVVQAAPGSGDPREPTDSSAR